MVDILCSYNAITSMIHSPRDTPAAGKAHVTTVDWPDLFSDVSSGNWNNYYQNLKKTAFL